MIKILIGLVVLSVVVFFHELGHFIAARLCGVVVETFSIGMGPVLFRKKKGITEYRISAIPLGGYCGMKGEKAFQQALDQKLSTIPAEEGSLYSVGPLKRIIIAFAGPFANLLMAVLALAIVSSIGTNYQTFSNKIAPVYLYRQTNTSPAKTAELKDGDEIIQIGDKKTDTFTDIQKEIMINPQKQLDFTIRRDGEIIHKKITPELNTKTGAGQLGIFYYVPLKIAKIREDGAADRAGLQAGDRIVALNGQEVAHLIQLSYLLQDVKNKTAVFTIVRDNKKEEKTLSIIRTENGSIDLGIFWESQTVTVPGKSFPASIIDGAKSTGEMFFLTLQSLSLLFKGVELREAVSGPLRITHMIGDIAEYGFKESFLTGLSSLSEFIAIICVSLFLMNLLPIPVLDGGLIFFAIIELIARRQIHPRILYYVQFIGFAFIATVFIFALWSDMSFFLKK
ncbi:RIP metalloprotease RseP [Treponema phagedenis]|uniref:Zinc metalloprotease n=1 Tax=Treponema phagedenis TaxID=162 RepID=A0AAE6IUP9_TREPH|nr:RIP metalloprotease RseP [Treponema phagedenis]NVP23560.1 RIP metalloprotease RseP [Treponema phagedenis]QEJ98694.1 RIP metalloprotease RseP [Treponema phagedenis]QEK01563.1 RIP metalloprotease RseP [Treponema phagedenis]QEK04199.1 RIP metalloprotease RseP [Treponema phagedenis]QEK06650.1 RIP metalloprotease RseP [Treponema phagedenis]